VLLVAPISAFSQAVPPGAGAVGAAVAPLVTPPTQRVLPPEQPEVLPPTPKPPQAPPEPPTGGPVRVDEIRVEGVTVYDKAALGTAYAGAVGAAVPRESLDRIVSELQTKYRDDGYILTVVRGSFEKGDHGRVVFVVRAVEGYISDVKLDGDIGPAADLVYNILKRLTEQRPVTNADLERALLLANDVPGVTAKAVLRRDTGEPGAIQLIAQLSRKSYGAFMSYDNRGSKEAGPNEMLVSGAANSFTSVGERLEALIFTTFDREQIFGQVNGDMFLTDDGLHLHGYFGQGNNQPGGILAATGFNGDLGIGGAELSYPIFRSRRFNWSVNTDLDVYDTNISLTSFGNSTQSASHLFMWRAGTSADVQDALFFDFPAATTLNVKVSHGLSGTSDTRPGNIVHFNKVSGDLTRVQNLWVLGDWTTALKMSVGGQFSNDILPTSEKFYLGGTRFGRGFFNGEVTGDRAIGSTIEAQENTKFTDLPLVNADYVLPAQFYQFWDYGRGFNLAANDVDYTIQSVGLGVRSDLNEWAFVELEGLHRLTTRPQGPSVAVEAEYALFARVTLHY
jgi:hemolysin activation/secretion protein